MPSQCTTGVFRNNPARGVALPPLNPQRRRYLNATQLESLADAAGPGRVAVLILGYCGLRWSELAALRVRNVDLLRRRLFIEEAVTEVNGSTLAWGTPKNHERRSVRIPKSVAAELAESITTKGPDDLLFTSPLGAVLRNRNARKLWFDAAAAVIGESGFTPHELRHTAASLAISAGASALAVQRMLGHASAKLTLDTYADLFDDDLADVADRLDMLRESSREILADFSRTLADQAIGSQAGDSTTAQQIPGLQSVETRGIEPLTPALQRQCSAN